MSQYSRFRRHLCIDSGRCNGLDGGVSRAFHQCLGVLIGLGMAWAVRASDPNPHWAYQKLRPTSPPRVAGTNTFHDPLDQFLAARLKAENLPTAAEADRATLCRRLYLVLTGLPPSVAELEAFHRDTSPDPVTTLTDQLLASPRFGERWGRHWLDVVRYADSVTLRGFLFKEAWRYRDYVIESFNADRPFDDLVREQVAGDLYAGETLEERRRGLVATTFWMLGDTNLEEQDKRQLELDRIDEQLDVLSKAFLGQTIACARCHDHKFDPIPARDYHAMAGILSGMNQLKHANVSEWVELPLPGTPEEEVAWAAADQEVKRLEAGLQSARKATQSIPATQPPRGIVIDDDQARAVGEWTHSTAMKPFLGSGYRHDGNAGKGARTLTFQPTLPRTTTYEVRLAYTHGDNRAPSVPVTVFSADGDRVVHVNLQLPPPVEGRFVSLGQHRFEREGAGFVLISNEGTTGHVVVDAVQFLPVDELHTPSPSIAPADPVPSVPSGPSIPELESALAQARLQSRRPRVMAPAEVGATNLPVLRRGNWRQPGEAVPRGVWNAAFTTPTTDLDNGESGRRSLAEWLVHPDNPLTARVWVNRTWHWVFGSGLVQSVDNFGTTGDLPTHPELLDTLASEFIADDWSTKRLVRRLVTSRAFRLASDPADPAVARLTVADPENRLLGRWRMRRLEAEVLRDALLFVSGRLDLTGPMGASFPEKLAADYGHSPTQSWRSVYLPVFRNALPEALTVFDLADPGRVTGARERSTIAPQALYLLNHPFVLEQAAATARILATTPDPAGQLWRLALGRPPTPGERHLANTHLADVPDPNTALAELAHAVMGSVEFRNLR